MGRFDGKVVLITGGARGQGRSHALAFAKEGAEIVVTDIAKQVETVPYGMSSESDLAETVAQVEALDRRCLSFVADARHRGHQRRGRGCDQRVRPDRHPARQPRPVVAVAGCGYV
jgi:NAD(P)-dependent dehydrogenase (short-subunit alcohol dehydrogenase family)